MRRQTLSKQRERVYLNEEDGSILADMVGLSWLFVLLCVCVCIVFVFVCIVFVCIVFVLCLYCVCIVFVFVCIVFVLYLCLLCLYCICIVFVFVVFVLCLCLLCLYCIVFGWFWLILVDFGWFWLILVDFGWFWLILVDFGWFVFVENEIDYGFISNSRKVKTFRVPKTVMKIQGIHVQPTNNFKQHCMLYHMHWRRCTWVFFFLSWEGESWTTYLGSGRCTHSRICDWFSWEW